jgi:hypothetical protein
LPIAHLPFSGDLNNNGEFAQLLDELPIIDEIFRKEHGVPLGLVVVDTMLAAFTIKDNNSASEIAAICKRIKEIGAKVQVFALGVHHIGKDETKGAAGSFAWRGNVDVMLSAIATGDIARGKVDRREFCIAKNREGEQGPISDYELVSIELGEDEDGDPIKSCAIQQIGAPGAKKQDKKRPTKAETAFAKAFDDCAADNPVEHCDKSTGEVLTAVDANELRIAFLGRYKGTPSAANRARERVWDKLCEAGAYATEKTAARLLIWRVSQ